MKILRIDEQEGRIKLLINSLEDLWHLERVLAIGDKLEGDSLRTVKFEKEQEKKHVRIMVEAERIEFSKSENRLRVLGTILSGSPEEFVQKGRHHTLEIEKGMKIIVQKNEWKNYEIRRLREAEKEAKKPQLRIIVLDEEKALTALVKGYGIEYGPEFYSEASKRDEKHQQKVEQYYQTIAEYVEKHPERFIVAGPGFTKENLKKLLERKKPELLLRIRWETCSYAERSGVNELFKGGIVEKAVGEQRLEKEQRAVEEFIAEVHKNGKATYGMQQVKNAVGARAVKILLVLDELLRSNKEIQGITEQAGNAGAEILIVSGESDAGGKLQGLGGLA